MRNLSARRRITRRLAPYTGAPSLGHQLTPYLPHGRFDTVAVARFPHRREAFRARWVAGLVLQPSAPEPERDLRAALTH